MSYILINANASTTNQTRWTLPLRRERQVREPRYPSAPRCEVCGRGGPGLTELPDGRPVHRWPCRDRLRDAR